ncbi:MAG: FAD-dependent oxidoreductase [Rhodoferax sp.]|uniref:FAD-dependent oxidoreductase n=1 Tax=Rhodoferax sp. TaxID=50421 RepID=UPI0026229EEE|nr:FAD-dependent oxidoreductase [Rhodoferax sp.]MDD5336494.1 FAD-dependent oxidoreductase [Rhodoferax sp.]
MKKLVLVGGGHAHLSVLRALANKPQPGVDVTLITPYAQQNYSGMLPGWIAGHYTQAQCRVELAPLVQAAGARLILAQVVGMDAARRCVGLGDGRHLEYDLLSLDVGSETDTSWLETLGDKLLPVKPLDNFFAIWPRILAQAKEKSDYRLVVVGAGAAGVEIALAAQYVFARSAPQARVDLVASEAGLLPGYRQRVQDRVRRIAQRAGLSLHFLRGVGCGDGVLLSDGRLLPADHVIATTGARAPVWLGLSKLGLNQDGYVLVDSQHRSRSHPNVFAAGDVCARPDTNLARSGVHAVHAGPVLAANLIAALAGQPLQAYRPKRYSLYLLSCGPRYAVASWGPWSAEGQWVWRWKDWIDRRFIRKFSEPSGLGKAHLQERTR